MKLKYRVLFIRYNLETEWVSTIRNIRESDHLTTLMSKKKNHKIIFKCYVKECPYS